jgi:hypothetical protein
MSNVVSGASRDALLFTRAADPDYWRPKLPASYADAIEKLPGVVAASTVRFYFGSGREEGSFAVAMGIEPDAPSQARHPRRRHRQRSCARCSPNATPGWSARACSRTTAGRWATA